MIVRCDDAVEIHASFIERACFLLIAAGATLGVLLNFLVSGKPLDTFSTYLVLLVILPSAWWFGISMWNAGSEYIYRADSIGVKSGCNFSYATLPFFRKATRRVVEWRDINAIRQLPQQKAQVLTPTLTDANGDALLVLGSLRGRSHYETEEFFRFIEEKIDANRS